MTHNLPTLRSLALDPSIAAGLSLETLEVLLGEADAETKVVAAAKRAITSTLESRYRKVLDQAYAAKDSDFGSVRISDGGYVIVADVPKKVEWDAAALQAAGDRIAAAGDDPHEYLEVTYSVQERKFTAWPAHIREVFEPARTVRPGSMTIKLQRKEAA